MLVSPLPEVPLEGAAAPVAEVAADLALELLRADARADEGRGRGVERIGLHGEGRQLVITWRGKAVGDYMAREGTAFKAVSDYMQTERHDGREGGPDALYVSVILCFNSYIDTAGRQLVAQNTLLMLSPQPGPYCGDCSGSMLLLGCYPSRSTAPG